MQPMTAADGDSSRPRRIIDGLEAYTVSTINFSKGILESAHARSPGNHWLVLVEARKPRREV